MRREGHVSTRSADVKPQRLARVNRGAFARCGFRLHLLVYVVKGQDLRLRLSGYPNGFEQFGYRR